MVKKTAEHNVLRRLGCPAAPLFVFDKNGKRGENAKVNREARIQLLEDVKALVGEHCNCFIFIANVDADEKDDSEETIINHWEGGRAHALGLMVMAQTVIKNDIISEELEE